MALSRLSSQVSRPLLEHFSYDHPSSLFLQGLSVVAKSWSLTLVQAQFRMPSPPEDYHMGFKASLIMHDRGTVHVIMSTCLAEVLLWVF